MFVYAQRLVPTAQQETVHTDSICSFERFYRKRTLTFDYYPVYYITTANNLYNNYVIMTKQDYFMKKSYCSSFKDSSILKKFKSELELLLLLKSIYTRTMT